MIVIDRSAGAPATVVAGASRDYLDIDWHETAKTILRRTTRGGVEVAVTRGGARPLEDGDVLWTDGRSFIEVHVKPCRAIVLRPATLREMGRACYEIGNKHVPVFFPRDGEVCVAYEEPLFQLLSKLGLHPSVEERQLVGAPSATAGHGGHTHGGHGHGAHSHDGHSHGGHGDHSH